MSCYRTKKKNPPYLCGMNNESSTMNRTILIIDDQKPQAESLASALQKALPDCEFDYASEEHDIMTKVITRYYSIALVDLPHPLHGNPRLLPMPSTHVSLT